jgi:hypothetical protein
MVKYIKKPLDQTPRRYSIWGCEVHIHAGKRASIAETFAAVEKGLQDPVIAAVSSVLDVPKEDIFVSPTTASDSAGGGICDVFVSNETMPADVEPLVKTIETTFQTHFPRGGACRVIFLPQSKLKA